MAGSTSVSNIARYDISGGTWTALGSGLGNTFGHNISALCVYNGALYAGGNFTTSTNAPSNYIAKWDGTSWTGVSTGLSGGTTVSALIVFNNLLFVGGNFLQTPVGACHYVAMWNSTTSTWSVPTSINNSSVFCFAIHNAELYLGGSVPTYIYKWVVATSSWTPIANSFGSSGAWIQSMASYGGNLYASGLFTAGSFNGIAKWNGSTWTSCGTGFSTNAFAYALTPLAGRLYAGGSFTDAGGTGAKYLASWSSTTSTWALGVVGNSVLGTVNAFDTVTSPKTLYAGGSFTGPFSRIMKSNSLVGIEEESLPDESVSIYPNPASDNIFISLKTELKNPRVEIYNVAGERIYSDALTSRQKSVNIRTYAAGIYFVKITSTDENAGVKVLTKKIVVE